MTKTPFAFASTFVGHLCESSSQAPTSDALLCHVMACHHHRLFFGSEIDWGQKAWA